MRLVLSSFTLGSAFAVIMMAVSEYIYGGCGCLDIGVYAWLCGVLMACAIFLLGMKVTE